MENTAMSQTSKNIQNSNTSIWGQNQDHKTEPEKVEPKEKLQTRKRTETRKKRIEQFHSLTATHKEPFSVSLSLPTVPH